MTSNIHDTLEIVRRASPDLAILLLKVEDRHADLDIQYSRAKQRILGTAIKILEERDD